MQQQPQFTKDQRNFLALEFHKRRGTRDFKAGLIRDFQTKFPTARTPSTNTLKRIWQKQVDLGTVLNCNSKASPGNTHSGRVKSSTTLVMKNDFKAVLDWDCVKREVHLSIPGSVKEALVHFQHEMQQVTNQPLYQPMVQQFSKQN